MYKILQTDRQTDQPTDRLIPVNPLKFIFGGINSHAKKYRTGSKQVGVSLTLKNDLDIGKSTIKICTLYVLHTCLL